MKKLLLTLFSFALSIGLWGQSSSAQIYHELQKLQNTSRVLYLAAHPDDENTRIISWLENDRNIRTAYLSLTRGDGGQNLIGTELGAQLGVLRTQELMQAREIDGGEQYFSRAVDFGYSKTADETLEFWDRDKILSDVVWVIRNFRPDVIITRFPTDSRGGHGHHTASAVLALEAFEKAASLEAFPEQLKTVEPWKTKRIFWNHSTWWNQDLDSIAAADPSYIKLNVGTYNAALGLSCNEIASFSRTQHKSQGFGVSVARGREMEYLKLLKGDKPKSDLMDGIETGWARYAWPKGDKMLAGILKNYQVDNPSASLPALFEFWESSKAIKFSQQREYLNFALQKIVARILGLHIELRADKEYVSQGEELELDLEVIQRSDIDIQLEAVEFNGSRQDFALKLPYNQEVSQKVSATVVKASSQPYWLRNDYKYVFQVEDRQLIGKPENDPALSAAVYFRLKEGSKAFLINVPVIYETTDRVDGEVIRPLMITPSHTANPGTQNMVFVNQEPQTLTIDVRGFSTSPVKVVAEAKGWNIEPANFTMEFERPGQVKTAVLKVKPASAETQTGTLVLKDALSLLGDGAPIYSINEIDYDHIDKRVVFEEAQVKLVKIPLEKKGQKIGYIAGAGDQIPEALQQMGYQVEMLDESSLKTARLQDYHAIIAGIRAYNTQDWLPDVRPLLMAYVENGGNYIVQYNTRSRDLLTTQIGPYPLDISRERVTEEKAPAEFILPDHPVLNEPNKITSRDFENWVQERGLYFAGEWDDRYQTPLSWHDTGEPDRKGALLIAHYGKGSFMYTGISFFRELPAGVEGAFRLLANMISYSPGSDE